MNQNRALTVEARLLKDFYFANTDVVQGVDALASLLDVLANAIWDTASKRVNVLC